MAIQEPTARDLRQSIRIERRGVASNSGYGSKAGAWAVLIAQRSAKLLPKLGGEEVQAQRTTGVVPWECWVRSDSETRLIKPKDKVVDRRTGEEFNITFARDMTGRGRWILLQLTSGGALG